MFVFISPPPPAPKKKKNVHQRLDPAAVRAEVELLQRLCDEGERRALKSVRHTSGLNYLPRFTGRQEKHLLLTTMLFNPKTSQVQVFRPHEERSPCYRCNAEPQSKYYAYQIQNTLFNIACFGAQSVALPCASSSSITLTTENSFFFSKP